MFRLVPLLAPILLAVGCKTQEVRDVDPLPFHVAVIPIDVEKLPPTVMEEGDETEVVLAIEGAQFSQALVASLEGATFARASLLSVPTENEGASVQDEAWLEQARALGADLILKPELDYREQVNSELNDKFWLNLPLFLLGGPGTWFVNDRRYYFNVGLEATLYDVTAASRLEPQALDFDSRIATVNRQSKEADLDFLDRADGGGSYGISIFVPSGLVAKESDVVSDKLELEITADLCTSLGQAIQDRSHEVTESELVAFHPESVQVSEDGRFLEGQMVLEVGQVIDLSGLRYRVDGGEFVEASFDQDTIDDSGRERVKRYTFRIPLVGVTSGSVQVEVEQDDNDGSTRTFTYDLSPDVTEE